jgi:O-antigen ligase
MLLRLRRRVRYLVFVSAVVVPVTLFFSSSPLWRLVQPGYGDRVSEELRLLAWSAGLQMIREHPLVGVGLGNFKPLMGQYMDPGMRFDLLPDAAEFRSIAHNGYIGVAAELGLPALLVYLAILVFSYRTLERVRKDTERAGPRLIYQTALGIQAGLIGTGVANFFLSGENHRVLWLMIFMSSVVPGVLRKIRMNTRKTASLGSPRMQPS